MKKSVAIIGAGLSGITVASKIKDKFEVHVFEKSRGVGGRMSTRKDPPFVFDHGAQFFKIESRCFKYFLSELFTEKIIRPWKFKLAYYEKYSLKKIKVIKNSDKFYVGVPNMDTIVKYISKDCNVILNTKIERIIKEKNKWYLYDQNKKSFGEYDWVILTLPAKQSLELINKKISFYPLIEKIEMMGCFSLMIGMNEAINLDFDAALIEHNDVAWLALNDSKPCRTKKNCLLINSSYEYASKKINSPKETVLKHLLNQANTLLNFKLSNLNMTKIHQWRYVEAKKSPTENYFIDRTKNIAVCGDWFVNSRVEGAFLSANELSKDMMN